MAETRTATYEAIRATAAWHVVARDGIVVSGPGALGWLQGQVSQDLASLGAAAGPLIGESGIDGAAIDGAAIDESGINPSVETLVLSPQGKIDSLCRVIALGGDRYLLDVRAVFGEALFERLRRFKLRVKADLEMLDGLRLIEIRGPLAPGGLELASRIAPSASVLAIVEAGWPGSSGRDVLIVGTAPPIIDLAGAGTRPGDDEAFEAVRIETGIPELGRELTERTIPQEAGDLVSRTVSFSKGCYTGQELVARIDARGSNTPRRLHGVLIDGAPPAIPPIAGDELVVGDAKVGELTSVAWSAGLLCHVALAYVKRGTAVPSEADTAGDGRSAHATIRSLPLVSG